MRFRVLSHACLEIKVEDFTLLLDPWLIGSAYWRSWWNYPPVDPALVRSIQPDAIYLTHVHWDHFHGPTLKRYPRSLPIYIPAERSTRMRDDLAAMGFSNLHPIPHAGAVDISRNLRLFSYQFSLWGDSAAVIEAEGITLLNANDAKFFGGPLEQILDNHGPVDFAFRSHSTANNRACYQITDEPAEKAEARDVYARSFFNFMEAVAPRYAIPFASNHCHLHRDVYHFNDQITTPQSVVQFVQAQGGFSDTELQVMISGDGWSSAGGFSSRATDGGGSPNAWFEERAVRLASYRQQAQSRLDEQYEKEAQATVSQSLVERFFIGFSSAIPYFVRRSFRNQAFYLIPSGLANAYEVTLSPVSVRAVAVEDLPEDPVAIEAPAIALRQALAMNMFSHLGISKRVLYRCHYRDRKLLNRLLQLLSAYEYQVLPLSKLIGLRQFRNYFRRWREWLLYAAVLLELRRGRSLYDIEASYMERLKARRRSLNDTAPLTTDR